MRRNFSAIGSQPYRKVEMISTDSGIGQTRQPAGPAGRPWPRLGTSPSATFFRLRQAAAIDGSANLGWEELPLKLIGASILDRTPGHASMVIAHAG